MDFSAFRKFFKLDMAGGAVLFAAGLLAVVFENSWLRASYHAFQHLPIGLGTVALSLKDWTNDLLMALFFLLVALEIKEQLLVGTLSSPRKVSLALFGALGGMLVPALVYLYYNHNDGVAIRGWAIPSATDIAFALGVLALFGRRVPPALKVFLTTLAVLDDLGAIAIIAVFYSSQLNGAYLLLAALLFALLMLLNRAGQSGLRVYLLLGALLWYLVFCSGLHPTLAGVALACAIPLRGKEAPRGHAPLQRLVHSLHPWVTFGILPLFGFLNAGVNLNGVFGGAIFSAVPLGIGMGLLVGKPVGVFAFAWLAIRSKLAQLPERTSLPQLFGVSVITGIGFTMSLFIGGLAFSGPEHAELVRLGVVLGSLASAATGMVLLHYTLPSSVPAPGGSPGR